MKRLKTVGLLLAFAALLGGYFFYESRTETFRLQEIFSQLPETEHEVVVQEGVNTRLQQRFYYLGSGKQCHAFLGEDQKTVLKFFRHNDHSFEKILKKLSIPLETWYGKFFVHYNAKPVLESCKLAYEVLPELTGIIYLHFNKTTCQHGRVRLVDSSWVEHEVDLDATEFLLQNYGELAIVRIDRLMKGGDLAGAKASLDALFKAVEEWSLKGIHVRHPAIRRNVGFCGDKVILLDAGSLKKAQDPVDQIQVYREIEEVTARLRRWICKHHPLLYPYFLEKLGDRHSTSQ